MTDNGMYFNLANFVLARGNKVKSRVGVMYEVLGPQIGMDAGDLIYRPGMSRKLGWTEVLQVLGGFFDNERLREAAPGLLWDYTEHQAYGLKIASQMPFVLEQLREYPETRRALVYIGHTSDGFEVEKPCVSLWQFLRRQGQLHLIATVRSWDLISGFVYDTMVMGAIVQVLASLLGDLPGRMIMNAGSLHIYEKDVDAERLPVNPNPPYRYFEMPTFNTTQEWEDVAVWAYNQHYKEYPWEHSNPPGIAVRKGR